MMHAVDWPSLYDDLSYRLEVDRADGWLSTREREFLLELRARAAIRPRAASRVATRARAESFTRRRGGELMGCRAVGTCVFCGESRYLATKAPAVCERCYQRRRRANLPPVNWATALERYFQDPTTYSHATRIVELLARRSA